MTSKTSIQQEGYNQLHRLVEEMRVLVISQRAVIMKDNPQVTDRSKILFGGIEKLLNMSRVILSLTGKQASDEMNVLLRTMVDLAVNICYLQVASDAEVKRFLQHDFIAGKLAIDRLQAATFGNSTVSQEMFQRINKAANRASSQGHMKPNQPDWSKETSSLKERAEFVDTKIGGYTVAGMYASIYTLGSGYTHASYKTIKRYVHWLVDGQVPHELELIFEDSSVLHGVMYVLSIVSHYFAWKYGSPDEAREAILTKAPHLVEIINRDYTLHMQEKRAEVEARISAKRSSKKPDPK